MGEIRLADVDDVPDLVELAHQMHAESRYRGIAPFSHARAEALFTGLIERPDGCVAVYERDGQVLGGMAGGVASPYFSDALFAFDYGIFVKPEHRGALIGIRLAKRFLEWARERGAAFTDIGISSGVTTARTGGIYRHLGMHNVGTLYSTLEGGG